MTAGRINLEAESGRLNRPIVGYQRPVQVTPAPAAAPQPPAPARPPAEQQVAPISLLRVGTRAKPYVRKDNVSTMRFNFVSSRELYNRERAFTATLEYPWTRNSWLEKVISDALDQAEAEAAAEKRRA